MTTDQSAGGTHDSGWESTIRLGQRLRRIRLSRNMTQAEVAKNLYSVSYVSGIERGQIRPSLGALEQLADRLQVPLVELATAGGFDTHFRSGPVKRRESSAERQRVEAERSFLAAQILIYQQKSTEAIALLLRLEKTLLSSQQAAMIQLALATCYNQQGRAEEARRVAQEALAEIEKTGESELATRLRREVGRAFSLLEDHNAALEQYQAAEKTLQELAQDPAARVQILMDIAREECLLSEHEQAMFSLTQASKLGGDILHPEHLGALYLTLSQRLAETGDQVSAKLYAMRSLGSYETAGRWQSIVALYTRLGEVLARAGRQAEALTYLRRADTLAAQQGDLEGTAAAQSALAHIYLDDNRTDAANQAARAALQAAKHLQDTSILARALLVLAQVQEVRKHPEEASKSYEQAVEVLQSQQVAPESTASEQLREAYARFSEFLERQGESQRAFEMLKYAYKAT